MPAYPKFVLIFLLVLSVQASAESLRTSPPVSSYTVTDGKPCEVLSQDTETGDSTTRCPGVDGFTVLVLDSDDRASITLINPAGKELPLNLWEVAVPGFSTLGKQIEWRRGINNGRHTPIGMIVRVDTVDQSDVAHPRPISFLLAARITGATACITAKIPIEQRASHTLARATADSPDATCLPPLTQ
ncbi:hypothetical protein NX774_19120 [Massilia agilis]|uniref:Uncharacterized protein n=1 Tax=Massilia agilis TaxID=1811226 RepID=A0ABT2DFF4_9BURK|nr:hypothetical protein [Massilia agilis]MCS0810040.1 hypothetical protein [Massilia agilis]